ncbi:MAG: sulfatase-like hydrolase/transferase, partial [Acidobacteria bacterium]|nr:sulfatase-like hydrolase/transferase [Acidobacteriota bacterium]
VYDDELTPTGTAEPAHDRKADAVTDRALKLLSDLEPPFFLWVHYYDPHGDYGAPPSVRQGQKGPHADYDAEIAFMDQELGRLLAALPRQTAVLVVGDHGEMLGEHGESTHGVLLHAGARRIPLLLAAPELPTGSKVSSLVRTVDVAPTLLELAGAPVPPDLDGKSLLPLARGNRVEPRSSYCESLLPFLAYRWHPLRALSDGRELFVDGARSRLFDLEADPAESEDLAAKRRRSVEAWQVKLEELRATWPEEESEARATFGGSDEDRRALSALGYLGGGGSPVAEVRGDLPDPYDLVDIAGRLHELVPLVNTTPCPEEVLEELKSILRRSRENLPALKLAGVCLMGRDDYAGALPFFRQAVRLNEASAEAQANLGGCLLKLGKNEEAETAYRAAL